MWPVEFFMTMLLCQNSSMKEEAELNVNDYEALYTGA